MGNQANELPGTKVLLIFNTFWFAQSARLPDKNFKQTVKASLFNYVQFAMRRTYEDRAVFCQEYPKCRILLRNIISNCDSGITQCATHH